ncbi:MAG: tetratricopeptide repeat protein [Bdellovibrio sp.]
MSVYSVFVGYFNGQKFYEKNIARLHDQIDKEKLNNSLLTYQLKDFQQTVAQVFPNENKLQKNYNLRSLASVMRTPASIEGLDLSGVYYEKAKKSFTEGNYDKAVQEFYDLLDKYPISKHSIEAHFFIAESYYLKKDFRSSLAEIDKMVMQYPQHDLTGFILLRMGQISELNNQTEEASEIYKTVLNHFENETLKKQAKTLVQNIVYK